MDCDDDVSEVTGSTRTIVTLDRNRHGVTGRFGVLQPVVDDGLEAALDDIGRLSPWMWMVFFLASTPGVFNVWHLVAYVFIGGDLPHWCEIQPLQDASWTADQIRNISMPDYSPGSSSCEALAWNYTQLATLGFDDALAFTANAARPDTFKCEEFSFEGSGVVSQWDLVCGKTALRTTVQSAVAFGKLLGAMVFGFIADKWGRKRAFVSSCIVYVTAGLISSFTSVYIVFVLARVAIGMAGSGTFNCAFTLLTEVCHSKHRTLLGNLYNLSYPVGMLLLPVIAYYLQDDWQHLQLALSLPALLLFVHCWFLPESPRWLISQGRRDEAWDIVRSATRGRVQPPTTLAPLAVDEKTVTFTNLPPGADDVAAEVPSFYARFVESMSKLTSLFKNSEMRTRLLICHFGWFATAITYYTLSLNADNFSADRYAYIAIIGAVEAISYVMPVPILKVIGRRLCCFLLFVVSAIALLSILAVPKDSPILLMSVAMVGRLCIGSVYSVIILYTSELFPTVNRNTAVGTSSTMSHIGGIAAPYVVDLLGAIAWYIPSTLCGTLALMAGLLVLVLPETKDKKMTDTVEQIMEDKNDRSSFKNCLVCK